MRKEEVQAWGKWDVRYNTVFYVSEQFENPISTIDVWIFPNVGELICLELPFSVCTICGKTISKDDGEDSNFSLSLIHPEEVVTTGKDAIVTQPELKEISTTDIWIQMIKIGNIFITQQFLCYT